MLYELHGVSKRYAQSKKKVAALHDVDLSDRPRRVCGRPGLHRLGQDDAPADAGRAGPAHVGSVLFDGVDLAGMKESELTKLRSQSLRVHLPSVQPDPHADGSGDVETALVPLHLPSAERATKAQAALAELGLADRGKHLPAELSGGEQQRVAIARALVRSPRVILADEPTGNLDERTRDEIIALLKGLWESRGQTMIVVTRDTQVAAPASRRFLLDDGAVISADAAADRVMFESPQKD